MWQDWVLSAIQIVFIIALVPTMIHANKKPTLSTGIMVTLGITTAAFVYATLSFWGTCIVTTLHAAQWGVITYQRFLLDRAERLTNGNRL